MEIKHPSNILICGPSQSGKTELVKCLISIIHPKPEHVLWCYGVFQPWFATSNFEFNEGLPPENWDTSRPRLIVLDDLLTNLNERTARLFVNDSHHRNCTIAVLAQNMFAQNKHFRTMSLNTHYMFLFMNPRDCLQIQTLGRQMFPDKPKFIQDAYRQATEKSYKYLCLHLHTQTAEDLRVRSDVLPFEGNFVYLPK